MEKEEIGIESERFPEWKEATFFVFSLHTVYASIKFTYEPFIRVHN